MNWFFDIIDLPSVVMMMAATGVSPFLTVILSEI
jgi:hypothetical protein